MKRVKNKRKILISTRTFDEFVEDARRAVRRAEAGLPPEEPVHGFYFHNEADLLSTMSPKRMELLRFLRKNGPLSCRKLAAMLNRSYANIHGDVQELIKVCLIKKNREEKLVVPWDEIDIAVRLVA